MTLLSDQAYRAQQTLINHSNLLTAIYDESLEHFSPINQLFQVITLIRLHALGWVGGLAGVCYQYGIPKLLSC